MGHSCLSVAKYLLDKGRENGRVFSPMKIIKLVYIAHGWMLGIYGRPLIREDVEAWKYGPVVRELYHEVKRFRNRVVDPNSLIVLENDDFDDDEKSIMDETLEAYQQLSAVQLSQITHASGTPWDFIYNERKTGIVVPNDLIEDHYRRMYEANLSK